jgi:hypothetical protein
MAVWTSERVGNSTQSSTRIHFVCLFFTVIEGIREFVSWAESTGKMSPDRITTATFAGVIAFGVLTIATFAWSLLTSRPKAEAQRQ